MTIKYFLRSKGKSVPVYIRVSISREKFYRKKTRFVADSERWLKDRSLQLKLRELQNDIENSFNETLDHNDAWIDGLLLAEKKEETVQNQIRSILENAHTRKNHKGSFGLSEGRKKIFNTFLALIDRYHPNLPLVKCDRKLADNFTKWLFKQGYSVNYAGKNIELLKTACRDAEKEGKRINPEIKTVDKMTEKKKDLIIITPEEQEKIKELDLPPHLDNARRWMLLGCLLGQRGGDLLNLSEDRIKEIKGKRLFEVTQTKTGKLVYIPIIPEAEELVNDFPKPMVIQRLNLYMKQICEKAGLDEMKYGYKRSKNGVPSKTGYFPKHELVGTHDLRRSFCTNFYGKIPTPVIMSISGHSSEGMFLKYIGKSSVDNALEFLRYF